MKLVFIPLFCLAASLVSAQEDLMKTLDDVSPVDSIVIEQAFKGTRLVTGHSVVTRNRGVLDVLISHRFGRLNSGTYEFFGLDDSNVRIGADWGITDRLNVGVGRNSFEKTYDGFVKWKFMDQRSRGMPISAVAFVSTALRTQKTGSPEGEPAVGDRLTYTYQVLIARKFSSAFSFQLSPALVHRNMVFEPGEPNTVYALGGGARLKLSKRVSLNAEYHYRFKPSDNSPVYNAMAIGFDIETGGHVFQLHVTNSRAMIEKGFIAETTGNFFDGDIHFGFNISRVFQMY